MTLLCSEKAVESFYLQLPQVSSVFSSSRNLHSGSRYLRSLQQTCLKIIAFHNLKKRKTNKQAKTPRKSSEVMQLKCSQLFLHAHPRLPVSKVLLLSDFPVMCVRWKKETRGGKRVSNLSTLCSTAGWAGTLVF